MTEQALPPIRFKHFFHIEGQEFVEDPETGQRKPKSVDAMRKEAEDWANQPDIQVMEINHTFTPSPRTLSIFATYFDKSEDKTKDAAKEAVKATEEKVSKDKKEAASKKPTASKGHKGKSKTPKK